jgi:hypothetical protein
MSLSLQSADAEAAAVAKAPRVSLADIEAAILTKHEFNAWDACAALDGVHAIKDEPLRTLSICIVVLKNGFTVVGKSAPASPENFDRQLGRKLAYEDCVRQLWPLMGFVLRDRMSPGSLVVAAQ